MRMYKPNFAGGNQNLMSSYLMRLPSLGSYMLMTLFFISFLSLGVIASPTLSSPSSYMLSESIPSVLGDDYFTVEKVGDRYYQISYKSGNDVVIFRPDRIEFNKIGQSDQISFLLFDNDSPIIAQGNDVISSETIINPNKSMAAVLGNDRMTVEKYRQIVYKNFRSGEDLIVIVRDGKLLLEMQSHVNSVAQLSFRYTGPEGTDKRMTKVNPIKGSGLSISNVQRNKKSGYLEVPFVKSESTYTLSIIL